MEIERHSLVMFGLYKAMMGDTFVREAIPSTTRAARIAQMKGFGKKSTKDVGKDKGDGGIHLRCGPWEYKRWSYALTGTTVPQFLNLYVQKGS